MANCRVGMATNPDERIQYWAKEEGYNKYSILGEKLTYEEAQEMESQKKIEYDCDKGSPGGGYVAGRVWSVYIVYSE